MNQKALMGRAKLGRKHQLVRVCDHLCGSENVVADPLSRLYSKNDSAASRAGECGNSPTYHDVTEMTHLPLRKHTEFHSVFPHTTFDKPCANPNNVYSKSFVCANSSNLQLSNLTEWGYLTWRSAIFLIHIALEIPVAIQGVWAPSSLPFLQLNNTALVVLKVSRILRGHFLDRQGDFYSLILRSSMPR